MRRCERLYGKINAGADCVDLNVEELQTRLAYQEDTILTLNDQIARHDAELKILQAQVQELNKKLNDTAFKLESGIGAATSEEQPPHY